MAVPNNPYPTMPRGVDPAIVRDIRAASRSSAADFGLLMAQAQQESNFKPDAKSATGSAAGLFQFVNSTWLEMVRRYGAKYGLGDVAQKIAVNSAGKPTVSDPATRRQILALRQDSGLSAALAGEYANQNKDEVERALGRPASRADLYMAHFLGAAGATQFLKALETKSGTQAASLLPDAAASNPAIFYDAQTGRPKSVDEIYQALGSRIEQEAQAYSGTPDPAFGADGATPAGTGEAALAAGLFSAPQLSLNGLRLTAPVATMLDTLSLAAIGLIGDDRGGIAAPGPRRAPGQS